MSINSVERKRELRKLMLLRRDAEPDRATKSCTIVNSLMTMSTMESAKVICCYVSFRSEVDTRDLINRLFEQEKTIVVPWCEGDQLNLTRIESISELAPRTIGLLEPHQDLREDPRRIQSPEGVDIFIVPGLAFTRTGDRLGYGRGLYDRLLARSPGSLKIGVAFEVQVIDSIPVVGFDTPVDVVVTENRIYT